VRDTFLRILTIDEKNYLHLMLEDIKSGYRAKIILLKDEGYTVPEIRKITNHHDNNIRKWIHSIALMKKGLMALCQKSMIINNTSLMMI
jgi:DNA-directed RNA polymerase specialized sigma24 family protein